MYTYIYTYTYVYIYVYIHICLCTQFYFKSPLYVHIYMYIYVWIYEYIYIYIHIFSNLSLVFIAEIMPWQYSYLPQEHIVCTYLYIYIFACIYIYIYICIYIHTKSVSSIHCRDYALTLDDIDFAWYCQVISRKRTANYRALLRKMTCEDKAFYGSLPPCGKDAKLMQGMIQGGEDP